MAKPIDLTDEQVTGVVDELLEAMAIKPAAMPLAKERAKAARASKAREAVSSTRFDSR